MRLEYTRCRATTALKQRYRSQIRDIRPQVAKTLILLLPGFRFTASHSEAQRLCFPFPEMQSSRIVPLASAPAGYAVPYSTTHDHCAALKGFSRNISKSAL